MKEDKRKYITDLNQPWEEISFSHPDLVDEIWDKILEGKEILDLWETVQILRLHVETIKEAILNGRLIAFRLETGEWQFPVEEVKKALANDLRKHY